MKLKNYSLMASLGLLCCIAIGLITESCARHRTEEKTPEEQAEYDSLTANYAVQPAEWADPNAFVKAYKAWGAKAHTDSVLYSLNEETLCAVANVVKKSHDKFTADDIVKEYESHKDIYDESVKAKPEYKSTAPPDTTSYDTIIGNKRVRVVEYTTIN